MHMQALAEVSGHFLSPITDTTPTPTPFQGPA